MTEEMQGDTARIDRVAMDRLRDRTDELELIISSLTIFALFTLPGWLFDKLADSYTHLSASAAIAGNLSTILLSGVCYGLGTCFVIHLMARAYWVGLIGLRSAFPQGIQWQKTKTMGPLTREHYQQIVVPMNTAIARTDRLASSLFAVISLLTLGVLWVGTLMTITAVAAAAIGSRIGLINGAINMAGLGLLILFAGIPLLIYLLDALLAARIGRLRRSRVFLAFIAVLRRLSSIAYPRRLILPVQLTLQSNLPPFVFTVALALAVTAIVMVGSYRAAAWRNFTVSNEFTYLTDSDIGDGFRTSYYEDMPGSLDRLRAWARISSFTQNGSHLRLFLPYLPLRDNLVLEQLCGDRQEDDDPEACLQQLWSVSLEGREVPMELFIAAERTDISMRGLMGSIPLEGLEPGIHRVEITWNPENPDKVVELDDRYANRNRVRSIPFLFAPTYEMSLP